MKLEKYFIISMVVYSGFLYLSCKPAHKTVISLYEKQVPNSRPGPDEESSHKQANGRDSILIISKVSRPTLTIYLPPKKKATGHAVIICPGGGYWVLAATHEGSDVAEKFNKAGIAAFVLKYRIPNAQTMIDPSIGPLQDAQRAIQLVRLHAKQWNIKKDKVGIMGFSAGGHVASTAGTHFQTAYIDNPENINLRPDYMVLVYPVISFKDSIGHLGSRDQLIGKNPSAEKINLYSNETQVVAQTPPAFVVHAKDDQVVKPANSFLFTQALETNKIPFSLFLYEQGGHGFGMFNPTNKNSWMDSCTNWILADKWRSGK